jgi:CDP-6-deoxy-D-xylo-4-hexulose-3-dehydrase
MFFTTNSGSSANLLAFSALTSPRLGERRIKPGDEVITVAAGFPTTVNPILLQGMIPVFVDIHIPTYNIDTTQLEAALSDKTTFWLGVYPGLSEEMLDFVVGKLKSYFHV